MFDLFGDREGNEFDSRVRTVVKLNYPTVTDQIRMTSVVEASGVVSAGEQTLRERNGNRFLFVWGSRWGGIRPVSG